MTSEYPDDADGKALLRVATDGADMSKPMEIDFFVDVSDEDVGEQVADAATEAGYEVTVTQDDETEEWTCFCSKTMLATYDGVIEAQAELDRLAEPFGAKTDGWGTFGNAED